MANPLSLLSETRTYYFIKLNETLANLLIGGFFIVFIYRATGSVDQTIIGLAVYYAGIAAGFHLVPFFKRSLNIFQVIQLAFALLGIFYLLSALLFSRLELLIFPIVFFIGLGWGLFFLGHHLFQLDIFNSDQRQPLLYTVIGFTKILGAVVPLISGFLIETEGFPIVLIITGILFIVAAFIPTKAKMPFPDKYSVTDMRSLVKLKGFWSYTFWIGISSFIDTLRNLSFILIPFFLLGSSELNLGFLTSAVAISAGFAGLALRKISKKESDLFATFAAGFYAILNALMAVVWNPVALAIRSLLFPIGDVLFDPRIATYEFNNMEALLKNHKLDEGIEFQIYRETLLLISRLIACGVFLVMMGPEENYSDTSRVIFTLFILWPFATLAIRRHLQKKLSS